MDKYHPINSAFASGTFGVVTQARHLPTNRHVAIKRLIHDEGRLRDGFPLLALREIMHLKALRHPNVIELLQVVIDKRKTPQQPRDIYLIFPMMDHDLMGLIENPQLVKISMPQIKRWSMQILSGLEYMHSNDVMHRDLKSANVLVSNHGLLSIADLGSSRRTDGTEYTPGMVTRYYRAPELLDGEKVYTKAIDIWSAGVIIGEMLNRKFLFAGSTDMATLTMIFDLVGSNTTKSSRPNRMRQKFPNQAQDFYDFLNGVLQLDPHQRFTAKDALCHEWFKRMPFMSESKDCPKYYPRNLFAK